MTATRKLLITTKRREAIEKRQRTNDPLFNKGLADYMKKHESFIRAYSGQESSDYATPLIPTETANFFYDRIYWENKLRNIVTTIPLPRATFRIPVKTAGSKVFRQAEGLSLATESGLDQASSGFVAPTISYIDITADKFSSITGWTTELEEDSVISIPQMMFEELAVSMGEYEELAMIQGDLANALSLSGTIKGWDNAPFTAGDVRYSFDGLIAMTPGLDAQAPNWTPKDLAPENIIDGASTVLTRANLNDLISRIEEEGYRVTDIFVRPKTARRFTDDVEFEHFQTIKDIGMSKAALIRGFVGDFYGSNIFVTNRLPEGTGFGTNADDSLVVAFDRRLPIIGDRRQINFVKRHAFYVDAEEIKVSERVGFARKFNEGLGLIVDVKNSA